MCFMVVSHSDVALVARETFFPRLFHASFFGVFTHPILGFILGDSTARFSSFSGCAFQNSTARFSHPAGFQFVPQIPPPIHLQLPYVKPSQNHPPTVPRPPTIWDTAQGVLQGSLEGSPQGTPRGSSWGPPGAPPKGILQGTPEGHKGDPRSAQHWPIAPGGCLRSYAP